MEKNIRFRSGRYNLSGILHIPDKGKKPYPGVIMFHGFTGHKSESHFLFTKIARNLLYKGISTFRFDFMGSGDSEGKFEDMTLNTEIQNGKDAMDFVITEKIFDKRRLGIIGLSMGAVIASYVAVEYKTKALVLLSPLAYPELIEKKLLTRKLKRILQEKGRIYPPGLGHYLGKKFFRSLHIVKPLEQARQFTGNVLLVHTKDDATISVEHSLAYFEAFHNRAVLPRLLILEEGGHTFTTEFSEKTVIEETSSFLS
ncbi:MAG: alpha/beta hydrolase [Candidatus Omnitrophica bacterium]|nr:alpha/beta hydrolase [Candidatus Omnitrophota bacterium]MCM8777121.1 alpha/beta hydrolase [Candidatus Omnitrophota bacterium]